jgi:uncharacterized protein YdeI (YjbR/CyaY-like superfamily)
MGHSDPRIDAYIAGAAPFAQPILIHLRGVVHEACPDVEETIKWGMPYFLHAGLLCHMAAFKRHVAFGFWLGERIAATGRESAAMGQFGRIETLADLPPKRTLAALVRKAAALNEVGAKSPTRARPATPRPVPDLPAELAAALARDTAAGTAFAALSPSHRREYAEWVAEAKRADTRERRVATTLLQLAGGKPLNWKYMNR